MAIYSVNSGNLGYSFVSSSCCCCSCNDHVAVMVNPLMPAFRRHLFTCVFPFRISLVLLLLLQSLVLLHECSSRTKDSLNANSNKCLFAMQIVFEHCDMAHDVIRSSSKFSLFILNFYCSLHRSLFSRIVLKLLIRFKRGRLVKLIAVSFHASVLVTL